MKALSETDIVVLCGGLGTRLREAIGEKQKTMAEIDGRPFLDVLLDHLAAAGGRRVILCAGYKGEDMKDHFRSRKDLTVDISQEDEPLGTGGALKNAEPLVRSPSFIALNGDSFCPVDYQALLDFHRGKAALATLTVARMEDAADYGTVRTDPQGHITAFEEKTPGREGLVNVGIYCFERTVFRNMPARPFSLERDFFPKMAGERMFAFVTEEKFWDIGTPRRLKEAAEKIKQLKGRD